MITSTIYLLAGELSNAATRSIKRKDNEPVARTDLEVDVTKARKYQLR